MPEGADGPDVTEDPFLGGRLRLRQPARGYRAAIDPVLLAAAVDARAGEHVLDVGVGHGAAALCLVHRVSGCRVTGIEVQPALARLARENAQINGLDAAVHVVTSDFTAPGLDLPEAGFDHAMANPPYGGREGGTVSSNAQRAVAGAEGEARLEDWIGFMYRRVRPKGTLTLIHRADQLDRIVSALHGRCGAITVFPLWPKAGAAAKRVIVRARRDVAGRAALTPGLVVHDADGSFTATADAVLRGAALPVPTG